MKGKDEEELAVPFFYSLLGESVKATPFPAVLIFEKEEGIVFFRQGISSRLRSSLSHRCRARRFSFSLLPEQEEILTGSPPPFPYVGRELATLVFSRLLAT